jgi:hypothetical protein
VLSYALCWRKASRPCPGRGRNPSSLFAGGGCYFCLRSGKFYPVCKCIFCCSARCVMLLLPSHCNVNRSIIIRTVNLQQHQRQALLQKGSDDSLAKIYDDTFREAPSSTALHMCEWNIGIRCICRFTPSNCICFCKMWRRFVPSDVCGQRSSISALFPSTRRHDVPFTPSQMKELTVCDNRAFSRGS